MITYDNFLCIHASLDCLGYDGGLRSCGDNFSNGFFLGILPAIFLSLFFHAQWYFGGDRSSRYCLSLRQNRIFMQKHRWGNVSILCLRQGPSTLPVVNPDSALVQSTSVLEVRVGKLIEGCATFHSLLGGLAAPNPC